MEKVSPEHQKQEAGVVTVVCPAPSTEAAKGTTKQVREMQMGVTVRKGQPVELHTYTREDR